MRRSQGAWVVSALDAAAVVFIAVAWEAQVFSNGQAVGTRVVGPRLIVVALPVLIAVPLFWRRQRPLVVCALVMTGIALQALISGESPEGLGLILVWLLVPFSVAAYSSPRQGMVGLAVTLLGFAIYAAENADITSGRAADLWSGAFFLIGAIGSWLAGAFVQGRRQRAALEAQARELEREARVAVETERSRIARELHDIVSHNLSVVVVQAAGARAQHAPQDSDASTLGKIERSGREALMEMRRLLGVLRREDDDVQSSLAPSPGIKDLAALAERVRGGGVEVELNLDTGDTSLPTAIDVSAYRIIQEALTNTLKHAGPGAHAVVRIARENAALTIDVQDDGARQPPDVDHESGGHGLIGMRERVGLFGGDVRAGPRPGGGFAVHARLPLEAAVRQ